MDVHSAFVSVLERDTPKYAKSWMVSWSYQDRKSSSYSDDLPQDFKGYNGPEDLRKWISWTSNNKDKTYLDEDAEADLIEKSSAMDSNVLDELGLEPLENSVLENVGRVNAQDYLLAEPYPVPKRRRVRRILDFGAGYGRQANLWFQLRPELVYIGVDGIPLSYCLQNLYYDRVAERTVEYVAAPDTFRIDLDSPGAYHLPTWRLDLIPSNSIDLVMCVQVLPELGRKLVRFSIAELHRVLKPGGALYLRDHDRVWRPGHGLDTNRLLRKTGFELEFQAYIVDRQDLWGVPRIWRKLDPAVEASRVRPNANRMRDWRMAIDGLTGGRLGRSYRRVLGSFR